MIKYKEIPLLPSNWTLDIIESRKHEDEFINFMHKRYGIPVVDMERERFLNTCGAIDSGTKSQLKGETRIVVVVRDVKDMPVLVHELVHAMWHAAKCIGYEMRYESQEWQAVLYEYMYVQATDSKGWIKVGKAGRK